MNKIRYYKAHAIRFTHGYWNQTNPEFVKILPTNESKEKIQKLGGMIRLAPNRVEVGIPETRSEDFTSLGFLNYRVISSDPFFKNYSDTFDFDHNRLKHYCITDHDSIEDPILPIRRSLSRIYNRGLAGEIKNVMEERLVDQYPDASPEDIQKWIDGNEEGCYTVKKDREAAFIYEKSPTPDLIGWVSFSTGVQAEKEIQISPRQVGLKFRVHAKNQNLDSLNIEDVSGIPEKLTFTKAVLENSVNYESTDSIRWLEKTDRTLQLMNGKTKPLIEKLPLSTNQNLKFKKRKTDATESDVEGPKTRENQPYIEIFIHL